MILYVAIIVLVLLLVGLTLFFGLRTKSTDKLHWRRLAAVQAMTTVLVLSSFIPSPLSDSSPTFANRDVLFLVDLTYSMNAEDGRDGSSRLDNIRSDIKTIAENAQGSRFGIMTFDYRTNLYLPMTTFMSDLTPALNTLSTESVHDSPKIMKMTDAVTDASKYLEASNKVDSSRKRVIVIMSDFELMAQDDSEQSVAAAAKETKNFAEGLAIGYGKDQKKHLPYLRTNYDTYKLERDDRFDEYGFGDYSPDGKFVEAESARSTKTGQAIAKSMGGEYIPAENFKDIESALSKASEKALNKRSDEEKRLQQSFSYALIAFAFFWLLILMEYKKSPRLRSWLTRRFHK